MRYTSGISEVFILLNNSDHMLGFVTPGHKKNSLPFGRLFFYVSISYLVAVAGSHFDHRSRCVEHGASNS